MVTILPSKVTSYRVFVGDEWPPAVSLTRVLAGVSGAHHGVRDLGAGVTLGAALRPGQ